MSSFNSGVRLSSIDDESVITRAALGVEQPDSDLCAFIVTALSIAGEEDSDWDLEAIPADPSPGRKQRRTVLDSIWI